MKKNDLILTAMFVAHATACSALVYASMVTADYYQTLRHEWNLVKAQMAQKNQANEPESNAE